LYVHILFDPRATHSFIINKLMGKLGKNPCWIKKWFVISTLLSENANIDHVYKGIKVDINRCEMRVNLLPLELHDFDVILGMDWLGSIRLK